jgi:hypothetical protein
MAGKIATLKFAKSLLRHHVAQNHAPEPLPIERDHLIACAIAADNERVAPWAGPINAHRVGTYVVSLHVQNSHRRLL